VAIVFVVPLGIVLHSMFGIRFTPLTCARLGHLALNTHLHVAGRSADPNGPGGRRIFLGAVPVNRQLFDMWKRRLPIIESRILWAFYQYAEPILDRFECFWPLPAHFTPNPRKPAHPFPWKTVDESGPVLAFSPEDHARGRALLQDMGLAEDDWFVCFQAQDAGYNLARAGADTRPHRNCRVETFIPAIRHITSLGGYAIRIGHSSMEDLPEGMGPNVIDYTRNYRSEFGDIYLLGNCRFFLGSSTGTNAVPPLFGVPVAATNYIPYTADPLTRRSLYIPKLLRWRRNGALLHFQESIEYFGGPDAFFDPPASFDRAETYSNDVVELVDSSEEEILDMTLDILDSVSGFEPTPEARKLQSSFKKTFYQRLPDFHEHGPCISPRFAVRHRSLIENVDQSAPVLHLAHGK
jgi:putative glycosyltransferase (TIGR04372 family)